VDPNQPIAIGLIGSGFIARGLARLVARAHPDVRIAAVLSRRPVDTVQFVPDCPVTNALDDVLERSDLIVECSGDPILATEAVSGAFAAGLPVVTMNSEFHVTTGSHFVGKGYLTEAEGDQPGCLAALHEEALAMGFEPRAYVNMKGYLNLDPSLADMRYWSERQAFSLDQTTSFTDGTKLQIEQALVANGLNATIARRALIGATDPDPGVNARMLGEAADEAGQPIADYSLVPGSPPGVFIVARHAESERIPLRTIKMGEGPYYILQRNYHLCALEIMKTVRRARAGQPALLTNSARPRVSVAAVAKRDLRAGTFIPRGIGSFEFRGEAVVAADCPAHLPIGLLSKARLRRSVSAGETLTFGHVDLPDSLALRIAADVWGHGAAPASRVA
jgi:predicted homoserine dehydrogenase-like protein